MSEEIIRETVFSVSEYQPEWPSMAPNRLVAWLEDKLNLIPNKWRDSAEIEITSNGGWDGESDAEINIYYRRPKTTPEKERSAEILGAARERTRKKDLEELERIKEKYGI